MEYVLHLTDNCNLDCKYCIDNKKDKNIDIEKIKMIIDNIVEEKQKYATINFYGGEPLLQKQIIKDTLDYINSKKSKTKFEYGITTNGTLLTDEDIEFFNNNKFSHVALSIDGTSEAHDINRITKDGHRTHKLVEENAKKLLNGFENVVSMSVISNNNVKYLPESTKYLINLGFKKINFLINYHCDWKDDDLEMFRQKLSEVSKIYEEEILKENNIEIILLDTKINDYIKGNNCNDECSLGIKSINVSTDGDYYPCTTFVGDKKYVIGNYSDGVDVNAREQMRASSKKEKQICSECSIKNRCKHLCACRNYTLTSDINEVTPIVCETERIIVDVADRMAERLNSKKSKMFIQKYYNKNFSLINLMSKRFKEGGR